MRFLFLTALLTLSFGPLMSVWTTDAEAAPACFKYRNRNGEMACRVAPVVAEVRGRFYVWGGHEERVCRDCSYDVFGVANGGVYDRDGNLIETMPRDNGPGPRWSAQTIWTGAAIFFWGGYQKYTEQWHHGEQTQHGPIPGFHVPVDVVKPAFNAYYVPGTRIWIRMSQENAPPVESSLKDGAGGLRACWNEDAETRLCQKFSTSDNSWGERLPE